MGYFYVEMTSGGKHPDKLRGLFTNQQEAQRAVDAYMVAADYGVRLKKQKEAQNAKDES